VSAAVALKLWYAHQGPLHANPQHHDVWRDRLDSAVLAAIPRADAFSARSQIDAAYAARGEFVLDLDKGRAMDRQARIAMRGAERAAIRDPGDSRGGRR
jgi:hypothetical protein